MFLGLVAGLGFITPAVPAGASLVGVSAVLVAIGLLDDRFALSHWMRLFVHMVAAIALIAGTGALVRQLGNPIGTGDVTLHGLGVSVFTVLLIAWLAINAYNMLDGMDGLAGVTALNAFAGLALVGWLHGYHGQELAICTVAGAAVCGFLVFARTGPLRWQYATGVSWAMPCSTLLGAVVVWLGIPHQSDSISREPCIP